MGTLTCGGMFAMVRKLVCLFKADGSFEGYTDSEGNTFSGEREEGFTIVDKFSESHGRGDQHIKIDTINVPLLSLADAPHSNARHLPRSPPRDGICGVCQGKRLGRRTIAFAKRAQHMVPMLSC